MMEQKDENKTKMKRERERERETRTTAHAQALLALTFVHKYIISHMSREINKRKRSTYIILYIEKDEF